MPEEQAPNTPPVQYVYGATPAKSSNLLTWILGGLFVIYAAVSTHYMMDARTRLAKAETAHEEDAARIAKSEAATQSVASQLGITQSQLSARAEAIQRDAQARAAKLEKENVEAQQAIGAVKGDVSAVKGDVASTKTDIAATRTDVASTKSDLDATKKKLESTIGDLGMQTGLIAHTRDDLETLKHRGDRNYYEFTLNKGQAPQTISTVSLQLKKADPKRGKYTLNVTSDDKVIEKKDRNMAEPIQFYSGRDHLLYELVVWTVDKNKVTGYVSTPKGAPVPVTAN